jgi:3-hydroxyacyl-[acyl-carrier-protein] dehydratase
MIAMESGVSAVAIQRNCSDQPGYSPFFMIEAIAQLGGIAAGREEGGGGGILAAIERAEIYGPVTCGDSLTVSVRIVKTFGQLHLVEGEVLRDGLKVAGATVTLKVGIMP